MDLLVNGLTPVLCSTREGSEGSAGMSHPWVVMTTQIRTVPVCACVFGISVPIVHSKKLIPEVYLTFFKCVGRYSSFLFSSVLKLLLSF